MFPSHLPTPRRPAAQSIPILRWGIIGPGWIAERFVHSLKTYSRQQVVAVASRSQAKADRVAAEWGIPQAYGQVEEMLARPDIDAVYIATPAQPSLSRRHAGAEGGQTCADRETLRPQPRRRT
ncbi:Myo-inositol 2-dehydrogenase [Klebsiella pneumoniae]|uniref:Myo-inositol 2-dehydrogenase n=1 Tax=Klebsiella pneumoniae TaxID=573 RepID=A0A378F914_KLEPN|nr:Myo-inositol 2-dehydrogenase [Klebsiella pneumoniae]